MVLVSACLMGLCTRYDLKSRKDPGLLIELHGKGPVPVCPEQLGGLSTPRPRAMLRGGDGLDVLNGRACVINEEGVDVTENFIRGAREVLSIARALDIEAAILKARSPSCGLTPVLGVTSALLLSNGINVREAG